MGVYFWALDLVHWSVFMTVPYYFDYYSFLLPLEIKNWDISRFVLHSQDCFGYLNLFSGSIKILGYFFLILWKMPLEFWSRLHWILHWIYRWLWVLWTFGQYYFFQSMNTGYPSIYLCLQIFFIQVLQFFLYSSLITLVKFIPKYFICFDATVNGIIFLIYFSDILFLVYGNTIDFYMLTLYSAPYWIC